MHIPGRLRWRYAVCSAYRQPWPQVGGKTCITFTRVAVKWDWVTCSVGLKKKKKIQQDSLCSVLTVFDIVIFLFGIYIMEKIVTQHCCCKYPLAGTFALKTMWSDWFLLKIAEIINKEVTCAKRDGSADVWSKTNHGVRAGTAKQSEFCVVGIFA